MNTAVKNPYVGPRTFQREDSEIFFGRDREARDLIALVSSERLILFYAQSGAGKSSLLNTRLIPDLEKNDFEVLPVGRVRGDLATGVDVDNIYVHNLMNSIIQQKIDPKSLTKISLSQFLAVLEFNESGYLYTGGSETESEVPQWRHVLIIDQFEEIFTTHPEAWEKREDFFRQLAQAMGDDPYLTVFLLMRDDYIASLDLYAHLLPGGLRTRYYMQRLTRDAALQAIKKPVEKRRPFGKEVAEKLVEDLASTQVQKPDGGQEVRPVQHVEPVQLQVVCYGLWESLSPDGMEITESDLLKVGDVNQSLESYYDRRVAAVAKRKNVPEQTIREWFDRELITSSGTRNMVLQDLNKDTGVTDDVIGALRGGLVHADLRAGQIWYELSHDRLIDPVRRSNAKWFERHLSLFQRRVVLWTQQGRSESLLLRDKELVEAEKEAANLTLTTDEQEFLEECQKLRNRIQRNRRQRRIIVASLVVSVILLVVAIFSTIKAQEQATIAKAAEAEAKNANALAQFNEEEANKANALAQTNAEEALRQKTIAEEQADKALAGSLAAQAESLKNSDHSLALLLGVEAYKREKSLLTETTLFQLLQFSPYKSYSEFDGTVSSVAVSPDGTRIAIASCRYDEDQECKLGDITIFDGNLDNPQKIPKEAYGIVYSMAFFKHDNQLRLAAGGCVPEGCSENKGKITLWDITAEESVALKGHTALVKTIAFSPDGTLLASGSYDTTILLWNLSDPANPKEVGRPLDHNSFVNGVSFSPDGKYLASAGDDKTIYLWDLTNENNIPQPYTFRDKHQAPVSSVAFAPKDLEHACNNGYVLATAGDDSMVYLWDWCPDSKSLENHLSSGLENHTGYVKSIAFNADGSILASAGFDNTIILSDTETGEQIGPPLNVHTKAVNQVAFGSTSSMPYLISVSNDRTAIRWDLYTRNPICRFLDVDNPECQAIDTSEWPGEACDAAKRNLTFEDWMKYLLNESHEKTCEEYPLQD